jgi:3-oxoacyl-[acyl-carrier-protein] synthase-3
MISAVVDSIAYYLPENIITNVAVSSATDSWSPEEIFEKTGIRERHYASDTETAADLAVKAAERLFNRGDCDRDEVDYILFCTQSPDYFLPTTACIIQERLALSKQVAALDFNQGCSGYVLGLSLAKGLVESGQSRCLLLLTAEVYSKYIDISNASVSTLFGDAGTATLIRSSESGHGIRDFVFGTDGRGAKNLMVKNGGMRDFVERSALKGSTQSVCDNSSTIPPTLYMNGPEIFRFAISSVPKLTQALLEKTGLTVDDVDYLVLHQANKYMLDQLVSRIGIPKERVPYDFEDTGNTVSCTIPIVLARLMERNLIESGQRLLLIGFGVGYSWAGVIVEWV